MAELQITNAGKTSTHRLPDGVGSECTIGSAVDNTICIPDATDLSPLQCRIVKTEDGYVIRNNQSAEGVARIGGGVDSELMQTGEVYHAASLELVLIEGDDTAADAPAAAGDAASTTPKNRKLLPPKKRLAKSASEILALANQYRRSEGLTGADIAYLAVVLIIAVYAGMALYSWQHDGTPVPVLFR